MMERFGYKNIMQVPRFDKIVLNIGVGEASQDPKALEAAVRDLETISGQKPVINEPRSLLLPSSFAKGWPLDVR